MATTDQIPNDTANRQLFISRLLNAPIALVWKVFTEPEHIKNWWGPNGFTNTIFKMDLREGGDWEFIMHGPDGTDYKNKSTFREIVKHERIVFDHIAPDFRATISFTPEGDKTVLNWQMVFESQKVFEASVRTFKADEGLKQNITKLEEYLAAQKGIVSKLNLE